MNPARLLGLVLPLLLWATSARAAEPFDPLKAAAIDPRPGASVPVDLPLTDARGRPVTLRELAAGRAMLLTPVQHRCPNLCGLTLHGLAGSLGGAGAPVVALGIDPREGPADAAVSLAQLRGVADAHAVTGDAATIAAVTHAIGYRYAWDPRIGQYAHLAATAVLTPDGRLSGWLYGIAPPRELVRTALQAASGGGIASLGAKLRLLCYHYDPQTGRYDAITGTALRVGAAATVLALAALIGLGLIRERRRRRT